MNESIQVIKFIDNYGRLSCIKSLSMRDIHTRKINSFINIRFANFASFVARGCKRTKNT